MIRSRSTEMVIPGNGNTEIEVDEGAEGQRLDVFLSSTLPDCSRSQIQKAIDKGQVTVNGQGVKRNYKVKKSDLVSFGEFQLEEIEARPEKIPLDVLYEDRDIIVVNKPQGMVVHPAPGSTSGTLVNALLYHCTDLSGINGKLRPGIVHRIDKDTSGILVAAKNDFAHRGLARQLKDHEMRREYLALVHGIIQHDAGCIDAPIGRNPGDRKKMAVVFRNSRRAVTRFDVLERFKEYTLVKLKLETGRTHQIRVHMAYIKHPVVGDIKYGPGKNEFGLTRQALHAYVLGFKHPRSGKYLEFTVGLPEYFKEILSVLGSVKGAELVESVENLMYGEQPDGRGNT
jgi:23S rRNA pseudouridine1911/1915/1917 synthase